MLQKQAWSAWKNDELEFKCEIVDREKRKAAFSRHWGEQQHGNKKIQITSFFGFTFFFSSGILFFYFFRV